MFQIKRLAVANETQGQLKTSNPAYNIPYLVRTLGIPAKYKGFSFLVSAVDLALEKETRLQQVTKEIYPVIAEQYQTNTRCVEKNLRTAINICWERGNVDLLNYMKGYPLKEKPSTCEFIDILVAFIKQNYLETNIHAKFPQDYRLQ